MPKQKHERKNPDSNRPSPADYKPATPGDLIGPARSIAADQLRALTGLTGNLRLLLCGVFGAGKSSVAGMISRQLAAHPIDVEKINGRNLTIEVVRAWQQASCYGSLFGGWKVKLIEEADLIPQLAQDVMLTHLDDLPPRNAIIGSSNQDIATLTARFQTRFELVQVDGPEANELSGWLARRWKIPRAAADFIALGSCGNVRAALLDAKQFHTSGKLRHRPKTPVIVVDPAKSEASKRAWETMRRKNAA